MNHNEPLDLLQMAEETIWVKKINMTHVDGSICRWASGFHPDKLPCRLEGGFMNGSYNIGQRVVFEDGTTWFIRLPRVSSISPEYTDEKVAVEIEALLIREKTSIPVPETYAWGLGKENQLGLGPFMIMEFINGVCLKNVLCGEGDSRPTKEDISDAAIEVLYRQMANIMLQLFSFNFDQIENLPTPKTKFPAPSRPLTWKAQDILRLGGVNTFGDWDQGLRSTSEYFEYVNNQDWQQLLLQPNSIMGPNTARWIHATLSILKSMIPELTNKTYDRGPFKLIWLIITRVSWTTRRLK